MRTDQHKVLWLDYRGAPQTIEVIKQSAIDSQGKPVVRALAEEVTKYLPSKDTLSEALAFYNLVLDRSRYMRDPRSVEYVRAPWVVVEQMMAGHVPGLDCFPSGTLVLNDRHEFVPIEDIKVGQKIWGHDRWSEVTDVAYRGIRSVDTIFLNNGSQIMLTPEHKVFVRECGDHGGAPCHQHCKHKGDLCNYIRVPVSELEPWMIMLTPDRIPFGSIEQDPGRSLIEGLYLRDGWSNGSSSFSIAGQDGCPKEEQKRRVEKICERLGIKTGWDRKAIRVRDREWALRTHLMGVRSTEKAALSISLAEDSAGQLLEGIMADSGANTHGEGRTFTTTSHRLFLQTRVLLKMQGLSCSERFIRNHGGLGENPIWRLGVRPVDRADGKKQKFLRVKSIERNVISTPVWDITTDDHCVYLPESDTTVSQCDDMTALICGLAAITGAECRAVTVAFRNMFYKGNRQYSHVFAQIKEPRTGQWITVDPVAGDKTEEMKSRVVAAKFWPIV